MRDRDHAFAGWADTMKAIGIEDVITAPRSPWQNAYVERFIGSARRECLDHVIVLSATGLQRLMKLYCAYDEQSRTHLSLNKDAPTVTTCFDDETCRLEPIANPFGPKVLPMSPE